MEKRRSGPEGPDRAPEPFEFEAPEAAQEHDNACCDCAQQCLDALFSQYPQAFDGIDRDGIVYGSGWDDSSGLAVRVLIGAGPENPELWEWARGLALRSNVPGEDGG